MEHFSVQAFFLTEIGPVPWNRVNKLLSCSLLFTPPTFFVNERLITESLKVSFLSLVSVKGLIF